MPATELDDGRGHVLASERRRCRQPDDAAQRVVVSLAHLLDLVQDGQHRAGTRCNGASLVGDAQIARVALEEGRAQRVLQSRNLLADGLWIQLQATGGCRETGAVGNPYQNVQIVEVSQRHRYILPNISGLVMR